MKKPIFIKVTKDSKVPTEHGISTVVLIRMWREDGSFDKITGTTNWEDETSRLKMLEGLIQMIEVVNE